MCSVFISFTYHVARKAQEFIKTNHNKRVVGAFVTLIICLGGAQRPGLVHIGCPRCSVCGKLCRLLELEEPVSLSILPSENHHLFVMATCIPLIKLAMNIEKSCVVRTCIRGIAQMETKVFEIKGSSGLIVIKHCSFTHLKVVFFPRVCKCINDEGLSLF